MNCFECATVDDAQREAVAVCTSCGAATCPTHSRTLTTRLASATGLGGSPAEHTRTIVCSACDTTLAHHHLAGRAGAHS